jgi:adenosine deaminase
MAVEDFVHAMPKAELNVRLEGAVRKETLLLIAEQNDIPSTTKRFDEWVRLLEEPDHGRVDEIIQTTSQWLQQPDDLTRIVYDVGVSLSRQNIRYAEVCVNPSLFMQPGMSFEAFLEALNDGRDRAQRGWNVQMNWILVVTRDEPRRADEIMRWATSVTGKRGNIVGIGLLGRDDLQPVGQFERAFSAAQKKDVPRMVQVGEAGGAEAIAEVLEHLQPSRLVDAWGAMESPELLATLADNRYPVVVNMARALRQEWVPDYPAYPLRRLYDENIRLVLSADMPSFQRTTLTDEYLAAVEQNGLSLDELQELSLNAVACSFLPDEERSAMLGEYREAYAHLRAEQSTSEADAN